MQTAGGTGGTGGGTAGAATGADTTGNATDATGGDVEFGTARVAPVRGGPKTNPHEGTGSKANEDYVARGLEKQKEKREESVRDAEKAARKTEKATQKTPQSRKRK